MPYPAQLSNGNIASPGHAAFLPVEVMPGEGLNRPAPPVRLGSARPSIVPGAAFEEAFHFQTGTIPFPSHSFAHNRIGLHIAHARLTILFLLLYPTAVKEKSHRASPWKTRFQSPQRIQGGSRNAQQATGSVLFFFPPTAFYRRALACRPIRIGRSARCGVFNAFTDSH